jgi:hypothetical protein
LRFVQFMACKFYFRKIYRRYGTLVNDVQAVWYIVLGKMYWCLQLLGNASKVRLKDDYRNR